MIKYSKMKQNLQAIFLLLLLGISFTAFSQSSSSGKIPYQAVARDATGAVLANQNLVVRMALTGADRNSEVYYAENHKLITDENGFFSLEVGSGDASKGEWLNVPWYLGRLWLDIEIDATGISSSPLISRTELQAVPFAFTAKTAQRLETAQDIEERTNFSIHWNTSGNYKTVPHVHFIGTRDDKDFYVKTSEKTRIVFSKRGQMTIYADDNKSSDSQEDIEAYQLYIRGEDHGIFIELNESRSMDNNYLTFADQGDIRGTIEGQTVGELLTSPDFINTNLDFAATLAAQIAISVAEFAQGSGYAAASAAAAAIVAASAGTAAPYIPKVPGYAIASGAAYTLGGFAVANLAVIIAQTIEYNVTTISQVGVSYSSGGADYAEYLKRSPLERDMFPGEIVGVKNGEISLNTADADHLMVISEAPAMLGNLPSPERKELFEKVAFMGQVPVKIKGAVQSGDYILPSGKNDGIGFAVNPEDLATSDFKKIIGVAWVTKTVENNLIHRVNISVGLNQNDLAPRVEKLESKVDNIIAFLEGKEDLKDFEAPITSISDNSAKETPSNSQQIEAILDLAMEQGAPTIEKYYSMLENRMLEEGVNLRDYPVWEKILNDPVTFVKESRKDPEVARRWVNQLQYSQSTQPN